MSAGQEEGRNCDTAFGHRRDCHREEENQTDSDPPHTGRKGLTSACVGITDDWIRPPFSIPGDHAELAASEGPRPESGKRHRVGLGRTVPTDALILL